MWNISFLNNSEILYYRMKKTQNIIFIRPIFFTLSTFKTSSLSAFVLDSL